MERHEKLQIIFNILLVICITILIFTLIVLLKNKDVIALDPLNYGMKLHNFTSCSCVDEKSDVWYSLESGFKNVKIFKGDEYKFKYFSNFNLSNP
jgi:hypothetical protein